MASFGLPPAEWVVVNLDTYLLIAAFLDEGAIRSLTATSRTFHTHNASTLIWEERIAKAWDRPGLAWAREAVCHHVIPIAVLHATAVKGEFRSACRNASHPSRLRHARGVFRARDQGDICPFERQQ